MKKSSILGFEGLYEVFEDGSIFSIDREVIGKDGVTYSFKGIKKQYVLNKNGYLQVQLYKENQQHTLYVHRVVAQAFIPNPLNLPQVNHIDGNKLLCAASNLEWVSAQDNSIHAIQTGLRQYSSRMSEEEWLQAIQEVLKGLTLSEVCERSPYKLPFFSTKIRKIANKHGLLHMLNDSILINRQKQAKLNGSKNR